MDTVTPEKRSQNMAAIKAKDTKPELFIRKLLFSKGYRYSLYAQKVPGHPDLYMRKYNTAVFVHGCFWHRHTGCRYCYMPKSRVTYWEKKFQGNIDRDIIVKKQLLEKGIKCLVIWECTVKKIKKDLILREQVLERICGFLNSEELYEEI